METNFKSQICTTREQSERLLALGLKKETADCVWIEMSKDDWRIDANDWKAYYSIIEEGIVPAWSLHKLLYMLYSDIGECLVFFPNTYNDVIADIETMIRRGTFNKEYLV